MTTNQCSFSKRYQEIQTLFARDEVQQAIKRLMDFVRDYSSESNHNENINDAIVISAAFSRLEKHERRGILAISDVEQERQKLLYKALGLLDDVVEQIGHNSVRAA